jgi:hypothetical protein
MRVGFGTLCAFGASKPFRGKQGGTWTVALRTSLSSETCPALT